MSVQKLEAELRACTDSFVNLVRAARIGDETASTKRTKAPGELVEVLAEKVLLAAQDLLETTAELKRRAFLAQAGEQLAKADRAQTHADMSARIQSLESELAEAEEELRKRGKQPADDSQSAEVQQLCVLAQELHSPFIKTL